MSFPQDEKRTVFQYNETPIQLVGPGIYKEHPGYQSLDGRKLEDVYESGFFKTFDQRLLDEKAQVLRDREMGGTSGTGFSERK